MNALQTISPVAIVQIRITANFFSIFVSVSLFISTACILISLLKIDILLFRVMGYYFKT